MKKQMWVIAVLLALFSGGVLAAEAARPALQPVSAGAALSAAQVAGTWEGVGYGQGIIEIGADGSYVRDGKPAGKYTLDGDRIVFAGRLAVWGGGRAFLDQKGILTFYWDADGYKLLMTFRKKT